MFLKIPAFICLGLFVIASILQLVFAFLEIEKLRRKEKPFCLLFLALFAFFAVPNHPLIYVGALLGMAGDILDLEPKTFIAGVVAFYLGHVCYFLETIIFILKFDVSWTMYLTIFLVYLTVYLLMHTLCVKYSNHSKVDSFGQAFYFAILVSYIPLFIYSIVYKGSFMYLSLIGSLSFIVSDSILVKTHFGRKFKRYHLYIMGTYLVAEVLIVLGFILTLVN